MPMSIFLSVACLYSALVCFSFILACSLCVAYGFSPSFFFH